MRINIREVAESGLEIRSKETAESVGLPGDEVDGEMEICAHIQRMGRTLFLEGDLSVSLRLQCSRCLKDFVSPRDIQFTYRVEPHSSDDRREEVELRRADMDVTYYAGETLKISDFLKEQIVLARPMRPLCREDCPGLCPVCGQDLNRGNCSCQPSGTDPLWSDLKRLITP
jgi:uncharacterized protein